MTAGSITFKSPGFYDVNCDIHPAMSAHILVAATPHVVMAGPDGSFAFPDVAPGLFHLRYKRKPWRCQARTVSGLTITSVVRQADHDVDSHAHSQRSVFLRCNRRGRDRCSTCS